DADDQWASSVAVDRAGNVFVVGTFEGNVDFGTGPLTAKGKSIFVTKLDPAGHGIWSRQIDPELDPILSSGPARATPSGGVVVMGYGEGRARAGDVRIRNTGSFAIGFDADGAARWGNLFGPGSDSMIRGAAVDGAGNVAVAEMWSTNSRVFVSRIA